MRGAEWPGSEKGAAAIAALPLPSAGQESRSTAARRHFFMGNESSRQQLATMCDLSMSINA
jgi:hypothetical protein